MLIGGLLKFTLIDYPGKVAAVVFTQGCNYRCPFCHNPELVLPELFAPHLDDAELFSFFRKRQGQLQGIVVSGGEPTVHPDLPQFLQKIKDLGFLVKLDTNGSRPDVLALLLERKLVDFIAMDIKSSLAEYCKAAGVVVDVEAIRRSVALIKSSGLDYQFRTTVFKKIVAPQDLQAIEDLLGDVKAYRLQEGNLRSKVLDYNYLADEADYTPEEFTALSARFTKSI